MTRNRGFCMNSEIPRKAKSMIRTLGQLAVLKFLKDAESPTAETQVIRSGLEKSRRNMSQSLFSHTMKKLCEHGFLELTYKKAPAQGRIRVYTLTDKGRAEVELFESIGTAAVGGDGEAGA